MRAILINTGTELLLGDVQDTHLAFMAREILPLGLRIDERRTVPDSDVIRRTLTELFPHCESKRSVTWNRKTCWLLE